MDCKFTLADTPLTPTVPHFSDLPSALQRKLKLIRWKSAGDVSTEDLNQELCLVALEFLAECGRAFDPADPDDQQTLLRKLNRAYMKPADRKQRWAKRIDRDVETEDGSYRVGDYLAAPDTSDPFVALVRQERSAEQPQINRDSYSEAAAYAIALSQFDYQRHHLSAYLAISTCVLIKRLSDAIRCYEQQASLFDRIERIPDSFMPREGRASLKVRRPPIVFEQGAFAL